ncbi:MAG: extracellular solute-binding protein [Verrucomicrobia bacterium]|nr:extracellular solute-binding protein [Verrucomicrobiota bacterium]
MKQVIAIVAALAIGLGIVTWFYRQSAPSRAERALIVYCPAGIKKPVEMAAEAYRKEFGVTISLQYGGTSALLSAVRIAKSGDLLIMADDGSVADAQRLGLIREVIPLAKQRPVIAVAKGNPKSIRTLDDLLREGVRFALANPESASIGHTLQRTLAGRWEQFRARAMVLKPTVMDIASDVTLGAVDAAIVWDATVAQFAVLEAVNVPEFEKAEENVSATVVSTCAQPAAALRFARYLAAPEKGAPMFVGNGFRPAGGDPWSVKPTLVLYSGGVNRPAIQQMLKEFADREGVDLTTVFNGCGILCATMRAMAKTPGANIPDAYYACDVCFVPPVAGLYQEASVLTETDIILAVTKGNPKDLHVLSDLARPGLKIGICNAQQSTLGYMTQAMLKDTGLFDSVMKNVCSQVPTADMLVNQLRTGSLDAAIVYGVNVKPVAEHIDTMPIKHAGAIAAQPFAVAAKSPNARLAGRLLAFLRANRERFEKAGFRWRGDEAAVATKDIVVPAHLKNIHD